jgi:hypothetical protein
MEGLGFPDHVRNRRGAGISQKHGVLSFVAEGGGDLYIVPWADVVNDIGLIVLV